MASVKKVTFPPSVTREKALLELWNHTNALGMGFLHSHNQPTLEEAKAELTKNTYVDYFYGKPIKTEFSTYPVLESRLYDRDAPTTMQKVADALRPDDKKTDIKSVGPTKKLTPKERTELFEKQNDGFKIMSFESFDTKGSGKDMSIKDFHRVRLTDKWTEKAKKDKIPYPEDWFMVMGVNVSGDLKTYGLMGSMGGGWGDIGWTQPGVIKENLGL